LDCRCGDESVHAPKHDAHAVNRRRQLLQITHIGAKTQRSAASVFDFQLCGIQLSLSSGDQTDSCSCLCETQS
jgi:hypothetical protein